LSDIILKGNGFDYRIFHILSNNYDISFLGPTLSQVSDYRLLGASSVKFAIWRMIVMLNYSNKDMMVFVTDI
jgi:hypothetical protein